MARTAKSPRPKLNAFVEAYNNGVRNCPVCDRQLQWKRSVRNQHDTMATVDHVVPVSLGGINSTRNYYVMCAKCNGKRGNAPFLHFVLERAKDVDKDKLEFIVFTACIETVKERMQQKQQSKPLSAMIKHVLKNFGPDNKYRLLIEQFYMVKS